jgi:hypothetical protein
MHQSDGLFTVDPGEPCALCGEEFGFERELVLVESGAMEPMRKDPSYVKFVPDHSNEQDLVAMEEATVRLFHADCFIDRVRRREWSSNSPLACDLCCKEFLHQLHRWAFRLQIGSADFETGIFCPEDDARNVAIVCPACLMQELGEGYEDEGELLLGVA